MFPFQEAHAYKPGDYFGEFAMCTNLPHTNSAVAKEKSVLFSLNGSDFLQFLKQVKEVRSFWKAYFHKTVKNSMISQLKRFNVPFLADFTEDHYSMAAELTSVSQFLPDSVIFREGDKGDCFYMIAKGEVQVSVKGQTVAKMGAGEYFGEIALVKDVSRTATVTTLGACVLLCCHKVQFQQLLDKFPSMGADFQALLAPEDMTIKHVLNHSTALSFFSKMLEKEFSAENMKFVRAVSSYRKIANDNEIQIEKAEEIYDVFISRAGSFPVNVLHTQKLDIEDKIDSNTVDMTLFDDCLDHILHMLGTDTLTRFKHDRLFRQFTDSLRRYKNAEAGYSPHYRRKIAHLN
eukprot:Awhi_evm1s7849